jgi:signal transduction histidine kinase
MRTGVRVGLLDVAIAVAFVVAIETEVWTEGLEPQILATCAFAVLGAAVALWRAAPLVALVVGLTAQLVAVTGGVTLQTPVTPLVFYVLVLYSVGLRETRQRAVAGLGIAIALTATTLAIAHGNGEWEVSDIPFVALVVCTPWFVGFAMSGKHRRSEELEHRALRHEEERREAVEEERGRIARELHDVIAHSVSVMVVQAGAAEEVLKQDPQAAVEPLRAVQETGRQALVEMTRLVGLLREGHEEIGLTPQPRLDGLQTLVEQVRRAGLPVELRVEGERRPLPPAIELTAYRVVQEALTNALKHAGEAHAEVLLRYGADVLDVSVVDDGPGRHGNGHAGGHGLAGMRERVSVFGGDLAAGPEPDGGFAVRAHLPLGAGAA